MSSRLDSIGEISPARDPLYHQVYSAITEAIRSGRLHPGDRLPTERQFCEQLEVSRATVRRALGQLVEEGIVDVCTTMSYDITGRLVEIGEIAYRADLYQLNTKLVRSPQRAVARPPRGEAPE